MTQDETADRTLCVLSSAPTPTTATSRRTGSHASTPTGDTTCVSSRDRRLCGSPVTGRRDARPSPGARSRGGRRGIGHRTAYARQRRRSTPADPRRRERVIRLVASTTPTSSHPPTYRLPPTTATPPSYSSPVRWRIVAPTGCPSRRSRTLSVSNASASSPNTVSYTSSVNSTSESV